MSTDNDRLRKWAEHPDQIDYTCGCGLYVNPLNPYRGGIHIPNCEFATPKNPSLRQRRHKAVDPRDIQEQE